MILKSGFLKPAESGELVSFEWQHLWLMLVDIPRITIIIHLGGNTGLYKVDYAAFNEERRNHRFKCEDINTLFNNDTNLRIRSNNLLTPQLAYLVARLIC